VGSDVTNAQAGTTTQIFPTGAEFVLCSDTTGTVPLQSKRIAEINRILKGRNTDKQIAAGTKSSAKWKRDQGTHRAASSLTSQQGHWAAVTLMH